MTYVRIQIAPNSLSKLDLSSFLKSLGRQVQQRKKQVSPQKQKHRKNWPTYARISHHIKNIPDDNIIYSEAIFPDLPKRLRPQVMVKVIVNIWKFVEQQFSTTDDQRMPRFSSKRRIDARIGNKAWINKIPYTIIPPTKMLCQSEATFTSPFTCCLDLYALELSELTQHSSPSGLNHA